MMPAHYFDGRNGRLHPARLTVDAGRLHIVTPEVERSVALDTVQVAEPFARAPLVLRLGDGATCEVVQDVARQQLLDAVGYRKSRVARWQERWPAALLALALLVTLLVLAYVRGVPLAAERITAHLPASLDMDLGRIELASMEARHTIGPTHLDAESVAAVEALLARARPAHPLMPLRMIVVSSDTRDSDDSLGANAQALADGTIIVTDQMVRLVLDRDGRLATAGEAQLLGVIAHEVGHIERHHIVRTLMSSSLSSALSAIMFGDFSAAAAGLPAVLTQMQYSRNMELEADDYAAEVLRRNGLSPAYFADILQALERRYPTTSSIPRWLSHSLNYLSTHPATDERIARLRVRPRP
jgi:Zn-dependent protease with chaperone function